MTTIDEMRIELRDRRASVAALDVQLRDYYPRVTVLRHQLIETFEHAPVPHHLNMHATSPMIMVTRYGRENKQARADLIAALDRLNAQYAPIVMRRRHLHIEAESLARAIERTIEWERKRPQRELDL